MISWKKPYLTLRETVSRPPITLAAAAAAAQLRRWRRQLPPAARPRPRGTGRGPTSHLCPAAGCRQHVDRFMCRRHWNQVPKPIRDATWATWQSGAGIGTPEHTDAILAAITAASGHNPADTTPLDLAE